MRCLHGSSNEIQTELDNGPIYVVQRLWDLGGPSYSSRLSFPIDLKPRSAKKLPRLHPPTSTTIPTIPSHPNVDSSSQTPPWG